MTKVIMNIDPISGIMFDCMNHAGDHDACTIMATLTNVLVEATDMAGYVPKVYEKGHVRIDLPAGTGTDTVFRAVGEVMQQAAEQYPEYIKIY